MSSAMNKVSSRFHSVAREFLDQSHALFPQDASALGLHQFDGQLGENDPQVHHQYCRLLEATLQEVEALPEIAFEGDDWLDRRGFVSMLRTELHSHRDLQRWRNDP